MNLPSHIQHNKRFNHSFTHSSPFFLFPSKNHKFKPQRERERPSPHPSLTLLKGVVERRNSRRVVEGSTSESSNFFPLTSKTKESWAAALSIICYNQSLRLLLSLCIFQERGNERKKEINKKEGKRENLANPIQSNPIETKRLLSLVFYQQPQRDKLKSGPRGLCAPDSITCRCCTSHSSITDDKIFPFLFITRKYY